MMLLPGQIIEKLRLELAAVEKQLAASEARAAALTAAAKPAAAATDVPPAPAELPPEQRLRNACEAALRRLNFPEPPRAQP